MNWFWKKKRNKKKANADNTDGIRIRSISYVVLFTRKRTSDISDAQNDKVAIDINNGNFYLLPDGEEIYKISDKRFLEIAKETYPDDFDKYKKIALQKEDFIKTCTLPVESEEYHDEVWDSFVVLGKSGNEVSFEETSLDGWSMTIDTNTIVLGDRFFQESTIEELSNLVHRYSTSFEENDLWNSNSILEAFGLCGNCGYAPIEFMGSGYQKDAFRKVTDKITYKYDHGVLFLEGKGATSERDVGGDSGRFVSDPENSTFCNYILSNTKKVVFGKGITNVGDYFLSDFKELHEIVLSSTIIEIGPQGFGLQGKEMTFKCPPIKTVYLFQKQAHLFGENIEKVFLDI